ncbi:hypothetical protein CYMTET_14169 [Cymbomonas tetramitiformis]|uniref:Uncharacterized protein n=1 Tax=Cymbomonas tetramitiformis TaxID=36881 RepID=A0AAE0LAM6_9CHLO|nr:hypothetical protein CYMTET_14169 [Cymbomonas tetramitiformis]
MCGDGNASVERTTQDQSRVPSTKASVHRAGVRGRKRNSAAGAQGQKEALPPLGTILWDTGRVVQCKCEARYSRPRLTRMALSAPRRHSIERVLGAASTIRWRALEARRKHFRRSFSLGTLRVFWADRLS